MKARYQDLEFVLKDGLGILTLNVPQKLNACGRRTRSELHSFWSAMQSEDRCRVIIMTGAGTSFCAGQDVDEMDDPEHPFYKWTTDEIYSFQHEMSDVILLMRRAPQPIIAAVRGYAAGGGFSMAVAADLRVADPTAKFVASYINIGLSAADMGSSYHFPRQVTLARALEYLYTGDVIDAKRALEIGLVNYVVPAAKLMGKAREIADKMLAKSPLGLKLTKEVANQNIGAASLESALYMEDRNQVLCLAAAPIRNPLKGKKKK
ncbi:MAG: putative enoyl-CoA hydratase echA8 [Syntrophorhabdus sp. PtaB.Bin047]|nr:MAG: putative enoyl-CoA hydratase echA8 [Syntrophorhabdus sp. PtaB.Bin047]